MPTTESQPLGYAVVPARRRWRWWIIAGAILAGLLIASVSAGPAARQLFGSRIPFLRQQSQFLNWKFPADGVAYTEIPSEAGRLAAGRQTGPGFTTVCTDRGRVLAYFSLVKQLGSFYDDGGKFGLSDQKEGVLFLHSRRAAGNDARLVLIRLDEISFLDRDHPPLYQSSVIFWSVSRVATLNTNPAVLKYGGWSDADFGLKTPSPVRILFGEPDPTDEAKFTIRVEEAGHPFIIRGQLMSDDTLSFQITPADAVH